MRHRHDVLMEQGSKQTRALKDAARAGKRERVEKLLRLEVPPEEIKRMVRCDTRFIRKVRSEMEEAA